MIFPFQTSWNGNRWDNFSSCKQFHLLTLNSHSLHGTEYYPRQDSSKVGSIHFCLGQMLPQPSRTMLSREARQAQQCSAPFKLASVSAQQGWWEHAALAGEIVHS